MALRVLLVDDDEALMGIARVFLERGKDLKVDTSSSAKDALEKLKSCNYDVIVADYQMPEMNGIEFLRKLKSEDNATPFILFTGRGREDVAIDALNSGASFYLQKGGDPKSEFAELANMIKRSARHAQVEKAHAELMVDLQKSRRLLITTLESTTDGILGLDRDGNVLIYNNRFAEIWGIPEQDIKSKSWDQITPSILDQLKDPEGFKSTVNSGFRELDTQNRSIIEFKDGRVFDYVSNPMHVDDKAVGRIANFRDITDQVRAEWSLRQEKDKAQQYLSLAGVMLLALDEHGKVTLVNRRGCEILGYSEDQIVGKSWFETFLPENFRDETRVVFNGLMHGDLKSFEHQAPIPVLCGGGLEKYIVFTNALLRNERGEVVGTLSSGEDVTERRRAEENVRDVEIRFQSFMNHLPALCYMIDTSDRYVYANKVFETVTGISTDDIVGKNVREVWPLAQAEFFAKTHQEVFNTQKPLELVESVRVKGDKREFLSLKFPVPAFAGSSNILGGVSLDITEHRRVENALRQANRKLALLGGITRHDAINQLSVLMAWLDIAMEGGKDLSKMEQLAKAQESARLLQGQLEFTAEYQEVGLKQPKWIDLKTAVYASVDNLDLGAVSLKVDTKGAEIYADPMLTTVFHNLVDNSLKYGEKITQIRLYLEESAAGFVVVYEDDGVGILVGEKDKIFSRGYGKHTGLGLYLAREILELTGIEIRETGKPGNGARFELLVPVGNHRLGHGGS